MTSQKTKMIYLFALLLLFAFQTGCNQQSKPVILRGEIILFFEDTLNNQVDLDGSGNYDLKANLTQGSGGTFFLLTPVNDSQGVLLGMTKPNFEGCNQSTKLVLPSHLHDFSTNQYACIVTGNGNISEVFIKDFNGVENWIMLEFNTWSNPVLLN